MYTSISFYIPSDFGSLEGFQQTKPFNTSRSEQHDFKFHEEKQLAQHQLITRTLYY